MKLNLSKFSPQDARKLASLSALSAGALVASMGKAQATVTYSVLPPAQVGFSSGYNSNFSTAKPSFGNPGFQLVATAQGIASLGGARQAIDLNGLNGVQFATGGTGLLKMFLAGSTIGLNPVVASGVVARRSWNSNKITFPRYGVTSTSTFNGTTFVHHTHTVRTGTSNSTFTTHSRNPAPFTNEFALFTFNFNLTQYYGWLELSLDNNTDAFGSGNTGNSFGPDVTATAWAFQDGSPLAAGDTGSATPEPGTFGLTGLSALALGAAGMRRWRAARAKQA